MIWKVVTWKLFTLVANYMSITLSGYSQVDIKMDEIIHQSVHPDFQRKKPSQWPGAVKDFINLFMYLAFIACAGRAPIKQKILDESCERVSRAGTFENIRRWYLWTPTQLSTGGPRIS